jgi:hypothetical protein
MRVMCSTYTLSIKLQVINLSISWFRIGKRVYCKGFRFSKPIHEISASDVPSLPNLQHFECLDYACDPELLDRLSSEARLTSIAVGWNPNYWYRYFDRFPFLHTLRLSIFQPEPEGCVRSLGTPGSYASLTTLIFHGHNQCFDHDRYGSCLFHHLGCFDFPNLRVISMQDMLMDPQEVYHFIARHPSLLEVNIHLGWTPILSLASLKKLAEGTGVWKQTTNAQTMVLDNPFMSQVSPSINYDVSFAFSRKMLSSGCLDSGYDMTAFAWDASGWDDVSLSTFMSNFDFHQCSHSVEHFSFACGDITEAADFIAFMVGPHSFVFGSICLSPIYSVHDRVTIQ